jgi:nitric oxide dioxygenase
MALSETEIRLVQESLPAIRARAEPTAGHFYVNLFAIEPGMRSLFRDDLEGQGMRFLAALTQIADALDDPAALETELDALAKAHARIGVTAAHFAPMGTALMVTLGETLGPGFDGRLRDAWRAAYDLVAREMIRRGLG